MKSGMTEGARRVTQMIGIAIGLVGVALCLSVIVEAFSRIEPSAGRVLLGTSLAVTGGAISGALRTLLATNTPQWASGSKGGETTAIKVRCSLCQTLNEESATQCEKCGRQL